MLPRNRNLLPGRCHFFLPQQHEMVRTGPTGNSHDIMYCIYESKCMTVAGENFCDHVINHVNCNLNNYTQFSKQRLLELDKLLEGQLL